MSNKQKHIPFGELLLTAAGSFLVLLTIMSLIKEPNALYGIEIVLHDNALPFLIIGFVLFLIGIIPLIKNKFGY